MSIANRSPVSNGPKRRWKRYPVQLPLQLLVYDSDHEIPIPGLGLVLSQGGLSLFAAANFQIGESVQVELTTPNAEHRLRFPGAIRNRAAYLYGIAFLFKDAEHTRDIEQLTLAVESSQDLPQSCRR